jgi:tRNA uridine 5-carbamoylmethylation protein Kti12
MVKAIGMYMIKALFEAGHKVVIFDETNYSRAARRALLSPQWKTVYYPVLTSPETCKERAIRTGQEDLIPVIDEMFTRYEPLGEDEEVYEHV